MNIPYFECHCDTISKAFTAKSVLYDFNGHINLRKLGNFSPSVVTFALFADKRAYSTQEFPQLFDKYLSYAEKEFDKNKDKIKLCKSADDLCKAQQSGKIAAILSIEGAEMINCDISRLEEAYNRGVRYIMPTWNYKNLLCGSCREGSDKGLSAYGIAFVERAMDIGIILDVSHISDRGFWDICELSEQKSKPFIASHSNSRKICASVRNLTDEMFNAVAKSGGIVGINLYAPFLTEREKCTADDVVRHIEHFCSLGGERNISLGCDFDGCDKLPYGINDICGINLIYDRLLQLNYNQSVIDGIFYKNAERVLNNILQ